MALQLKFTLLVNVDRSADFIMYLWDFKWNENNETIPEF